MRAACAFSKEPPRLGALRSENRLVTAAAPSAATAATAERREGARAEGRLAFTGPADPGEHRDGPLGGLLTVGTVGPSGAHRLELFELVAASRAVVLVQRHTVPPNGVSLPANLPDPGVRGQVWSIKESLAKRIRIKNPHNPLTNYAIRNREKATALPDRVTEDATGRKAKRRESQGRASSKATTWRLRLVKIHCRCGPSSGIHRSNQIRRNSSHCSGLWNPNLSRQVS